MASKRLKKKKHKEQIVKRLKLNEKKIKKEKLTYEKLVKREKIANNQKLKREKQKIKTQKEREKRQRQKEREKIKKVIAKEKRKRIVHSEKSKQLRDEVYRLVSMANKRLRRLEQKGYTDNPSYLAWKNSGAKPFSAKGKNYNELQSEKWRIKNFLDNKTSTVKGTNEYLKEMAKNMGIKYKNIDELRSKSKKMFILTDKIRQYYDKVNEKILALGSTRIWNEIKQMEKADLIDLNNAEEIDIDEYIKKLDELLKKEQEKEKQEKIKRNPFQFIDF